MGKIEEVIYENYKRAITDGNLDQASRALELAQILKTKVERESFIDFPTLKIPSSQILGRFFNPLPYKYDPETGTVELDSSTINLTPSENKLFYLFSLNETKGKDIRIIKKSDIATHMWESDKYQKSAIRIAIYRLRKKLEPDANNPQILISLPSKGYIFLGNKVATF